MNTQALIALKTDNFEMSNALENDRKGDAGITHLAIFDLGWSCLSCFVEFEPIRLSHLCVYRPAIVWLANALINAVEISIHKCPLFLVAYSRRRVQMRG